MSGDYSRFTFDPEKNYAAVLEQQGRVGLDADANEAAEIQDRRWRAETMDVIGRCAVPDATTPDAFLITPVIRTVGSRGWRDLEIGVGRMYVDGLLAENHGTGRQSFDASLDEMRGGGAVFYTEQPYLPPASADLGRDERIDLVYLDVWQREVTALQDPEIREVALGGPDTATRLQTVWQVRVQGVRTLACAGAALPASTAPSGAVTTRLSTQQ